MNVRNYAGNYKEAYDDTIVDDSNIYETKLVFFRADIILQTTIHTLILRTNTTK